MGVLILTNVHVSYQNGCIMRIKNDQHDISVLPDSIVFNAQMMHVSGNGKTYAVPFDQIRQGKSFDVFKDAILTQFNSCNSGT